MIPFPYGSCKAIWAGGPAVLSNFLLAASTNKEGSVLLCHNCFPHCALVSVWYSRDKINGSLCSEVKRTNLLKELYFPPKLLSYLWDYKARWWFRGEWEDIILICDAIPDPLLIFIQLCFRGRSSLQHTTPWKLEFTLALLLLSYYDSADVW